MDLFNFSDDAAAIKAAIPQFEASWGLGIFVLGLIGLTFAILQSWREKSWRKKAVGPDGQEFTSGPLSSKTTTKAPPLDRQPINHAYEHLMEVGVFEEDGNEPMQIAGLLRQAALDGDILIWGAEPSFAPVEWQTPILLAIDRDYWRHHGIDPVRLMIDASKLPDKGCETQRETRPWDDQTECYWHLHVDMKQVRSKWTDIHEARL